MTYSESSNAYVPGTPFDFTDIRSGLTSLPNFNSPLELSHAHIAMRTAEYLGFDYTELTIEQALRFIATTSVVGTVEGVPL